MNPLADDLLPSSTRAWVEEQLGADSRVTEVERLLGGWTSDMRLLSLESPEGTRVLVLRSFTKPFFIRHAEGLLNREAAMLRLLEGSAVPVAKVIAVDPTGAHCAFPSLLRTHLPGAIQLQDRGAPQRIELLAELLVRIHRVVVIENARPRTYQAWTRADMVRTPEASAHPELWARAVDVIRQPAPAYEGCFMHRDFHPGNVLFDATQPEATPRISGVVDWVETSWGPSDLDVAHCSTALALLHGADVGLRFADLYVQAGGRLAADPRARLYWYLLDALHYSPDAEKLVVPWREAGRPDLTQAMVAERLERYVFALMAKFG